MKNTIPDESEMKSLITMAKAAAQSGYYNKLGNIDGILAIMLLAKELDFPPMQAISGGIWAIQGKIEMSARFMNLKIRQAGHKIKIERSDIDGCVITGERLDTKETYTATFDKSDAERAGVLNKQIWKNYPREMYFSRALSILARFLFPDVIGNAYVEYETRDQTDDKIPDTGLAPAKESEKQTPIAQEPVLTPSEPPVAIENEIDQEMLVERLATHYKCPFVVARDFITALEEKRGNRNFYKKLFENPNLCEKQFAEVWQTAIVELQEELN